ncbi:MAG: hypothetical protein QOJ28_1203 [Mycobacterium sp.]|nr:hypothetical protein [Mycobacterium sp.]MDT5248569.1 hypothetical protein [Mycobacterium sp.]
MGAKHTEGADRARCEATHRVAHRGKQLPLEYVIRKQSHDTAALFGLNDRGVIGVGKRADVNVIDMDALTLHAPRMAYDSPAGGHRLVQGSSGYSATIVNGVVTRRDGVDEFCLD